MADDSGAPGGVLNNDISLLAGQPRLQRSGRMHMLAEHSCLFVPIEMESAWLSASGDGANVETLEHFRAARWTKRTDLARCLRTGPSESDLMGSSCRRWLSVKSYRTVSVG